MRAVVKAKPGRGIEILELPKPEIKSNDVLVEVKMSSVGTSDLYYYLWDEEAQMMQPPPLPLILGHSCAGVVAEVGSEVSRLKVGDRVVADSWGGCGVCYYCRLGRFNLCEIQPRLGIWAQGTMADYAAIPEVSLYKLPESVTYEEAGAFIHLALAVASVEVSWLKPGDDAVVMGPGPVGILHSLVVRANGAGRVVVLGLDIDSSRLERISKLGFKTINADKEDAEKKVMEVTGGRGADVVFDCAGALPQAMSLVKRGGQIVNVAMTAKPQLLDTNQLVFKAVTITGRMSRWPSSWYRAINLVANRIIDVRPVVTHSFPLEKVEEAFAVLEAREALKVIVIP